MADHVGLIVAAFRGRKLARSPVYQWLLAHYGELSDARKPNHRVDWVGVAAELTALGLKADGKKPLKPETVRRTWHRVESDVKAGVIVPGISNAKAPTVESPPHPNPAPPLPTVRHDEPDDDVSDDEFFGRITKIT